MDVQKDVQKIPNNQDIKERIKECWINMGWVQTWSTSTRGNEGTDEQRMSEDEIGGRNAKLIDEGRVNGLRRREDQERSGQMELRCSRRYRQEIYERKGSVWSEA